MSRTGRTDTAEVRREGPQSGANPMSEPGADRPSQQSVVATAGQSNGYSKLSCQYQRLKLHQVGSGSQD